MPDGEHELEFGTSESRRLSALGAEARRPICVTGSFALTLTAIDDPAETIAIEDGSIDVPYVDIDVTDGSLACLLSLVGIGEGSCRA